MKKKKQNNNQPQKKVVNMNGLTEREVRKRRNKCGKNELISIKEKGIFTKIIDTICEPMFLLLLFTATVYFILGEVKDGLIMLIFVVAVISIDIFQERKTDKTLKALKKLTITKTTVIREGKRKIIDATEIVPGDVIVIQGGTKVPADACILKLNGLCVDESTLTGESLPVYKNLQNTSDTPIKTNRVYQGTFAISGSAIAVVERIGIHTYYGRISKDISEQKPSIPPLKKQINKLVKVCGIIAFLLFLTVTTITYLNLAEYDLKVRLTESILSGLTLAMAMIPEEFPVVLTVFLSIGAWRLARQHSLVKRLPSVETLGQVSVLCIDKTGTITTNEMEVEEVWAKETKEDLAETMGMCSMFDTYDPMEEAIFEYCEKLNISKEHMFSGEELKEYPFTNEKKMVGRLWLHDEEIILTAKGSYENIIDICELTEKEKEEVLQKASEMSESGKRVIAVAKKIYQTQEEVKEKLEENTLELCGLVSLIDPPRESIKEDIETIKNAGIKVIMITGDSIDTATSIAKKVGLTEDPKVLTGFELEKYSNEMLKEKIKDIDVAARVLPEHKYKIVKALQENDLVVAMTGDGVNDSSALKAADIGIAMGKKGSEIAKESADLILLDDNFKTIINTIKDGRRIYDNIKKAIGYILVIHIPIALSALVGPLLKISTEYLLLLPIHIVLLELIIDPTSSIIFERQPEEKDIMKKQPRKKEENILNGGNLIKSIIQGIVIFLAAFTTYYTLLINDYTTTEQARSMGLTIIIIANLFLVLVNSSENDYIYTRIKALLKTKTIWIISILTLTLIGVILYSPLNTILKLEALPLEQLLFAIVVGAISVLWYEIIKFFKKG